MFEMYDLLMLLVLHEDAERLVKEIRNSADKGKNEEKPLNDMCGMSQMNRICIFYDNHSECCEKVNKQETRNDKSESSEDWKLRRAKDVEQFVKNREYEKLCARELHDLCIERGLYCKRYMSRKYYLDLLENDDICNDYLEHPVNGRMVGDALRKVNDNLDACSAIINSGLTTDSFVNKIKQAIKFAEQNGEVGAVFTISAMKKVCSDIQKMQDMFKVLKECKCQCMKDVDNAEDE